MTKDLTRLFGQTLTTQAFLNFHIEYYSKGGEREGGRGVMAVLGTKL